MFRRSVTFAVVLVSIVLCHVSAATEDANQLTDMDDANPWYPQTDFPKLITPQWVGEDGVEAVIVLAIDDMRDPAKYEAYLRPILNRLKQIDGRAPVSIMTCEVKPDDPQLQSWLGEGLSIECHTIDHPCPILQGGDFANAKSTYDRCVDLMDQIPGNKPVAFRTPCCDSLNTVSPRFYSEIFSKQTEHGNFLQIDSSVFTFFTSEDKSLPRELVLDANGNERFLKYLPKGNNFGGNVHNNFVNWIPNYPYPYVINNSCWQIPCLAPSDWSAQHLHGINNPVTVEDWKAAIDLTVHKQGCFSLVFHPHGWIKPEQVVELIDHAVTKHGTKVKFLNFAEVADRLGKNKSGDRRSEWWNVTREARRAGPASNESTGPPLELADLIASDTQLSEWWAGAALVPPYGLWPIRRADGSHNGFFIRDRHLCWINEDTAHLPDLMYRVSFDEILAEHRREKARDALPPIPVGAAIIDVTPDYPVRLTGYGNRMKESEGVAARIHARAMVIGGQGGEPKAESGESQNETNNNAAASAFRSPRSALITVDNCGIPLELTEAVFARVAAKHNIPRERFAISSTHSHSAPWIRGFAPNIFAEVPDDHAAHLAEYEQELADKLVDVVDQAIANQRDGYLSLGYGRAGFAMNRRLLSGGKWTNFGEVPDGPTDTRVPVLAAHDTDGKLIAVLANYACHCTTETGEFNQISGDWAGFAADMLETDHPGAVALIAIGCGADANPSPRGTHELAKVHGRTLADEVGRVLASGRALAAGSLRGRSGPSSLLPRAGGEGQGERAAALASSAAERAAPSSGLPATFSPEFGGEGTLHRINPAITCSLARIHLPLAAVPKREELEQQATDTGVTGSRARYFLKMLDDGHDVPTTIPDYPVQTWCFGEDLAMVFLGGEVVVDYSIRLNEMFDSDRLWINAYSNDVPCYIASARLLREGGYETDSSMLYYRRPARLAPETEDLICDTVQKLLPHEFYSERLEQDFPAPKSPEESLKCMATKPGLRVVLAASEPLIRDPVAFDWDERGRLWVVEMGDYPSGEAHGVELRSSPLPRFAGDGQGEGAAALASNAADRAPPSSGLPATFSPELGGEGRSAGRVRMLTDTDGDFVYDEAVTFLDNIAFPNGIHCWRDGVIITAAPDILYAEDTSGDGVADVKQVLYTGFTEGNQQHRVNGLRWGLDGWLYLANGDSGGEVSGTGTRWIDGKLVTERGEPIEENGKPKAETGESQGGASNNAAAPAFRSPLSAVALRGRDLRIDPDTNELDVISGQTQFGRERDDFGNWFGNNNSNPIWQYVIEDRYVRRNPHARIADVIAPVSVIPGAAPVYPTSRTLARFNDFGQANRFTSACGTMIYRDTWLGEQYYGNAFTCEPVHNLVSRLVLTHDGYGFKGERAADEQQSEFLASSDNWFRPVMARTGPDGALWIADMYRAVIEHPEWIPPEYQRKMNLYAGNDRGRIYRVVRADECCGDATHASGMASALREHVETDATANEATNTLGGLTPSRSPDKYFDKPWHEIPITELIERLHSPNGWWRDTAQRILLQRLSGKPDSSAGVPLDFFSPESSSIAIRVQAVASVDRIPGETNDLPAAAIGLDDPAPEVRVVAIRMLEPSLRTDTARALKSLELLAGDSDPAVRLQLMLSLGEARGDSGAQLLGQMLRDNFDDSMLRSAGLTSLTPENINSVLTEVLANPVERQNDELIALLLDQAARMGLSEELIQPLVALVKSLDRESPAARFDLVAQTVASVSVRIGDTEWTKHSVLVNTVKAAQLLAADIARHTQGDDEQRAAAIRFLSATSAADADMAIDVSEFLSPRHPQAVQLAALELLASDSASESVNAVVAAWPRLDAVVRSEAIARFLQRQPTAAALIEQLEVGRLAAGDLDATQRDRLLNHRSERIAEAARRLFDAMTPSPRTDVVAHFKSQISNLKSDAAAGKTVFEKRCATCHRLQDIGKEVGADLAALKDRSTDALLTAVLDPNRAAEAKFLVYSVVTKDGLQHAGMIKGETGGSLTLIGSDGKDITIARAEIEDLTASNRSLMPEGLEKDLSPQDLADVIAFVQSSGTPWKRFDGNSPRVIEPNDDGSITLPASAAEIFGPSLVFEPHYGNLGYWSSTNDYATWTFDVPRSGFWTVEFDLACDDSTSGSLVRLSTGNRMLTARVPGTGSWDNYQTWRAGTIDLHRGRAQLIVTPVEQPPFAAMDVRAIRLLPPE